MISPAPHYFDLKSVVELSRSLGYGRIPFRILQESDYPASRIYKLGTMGSPPAVLFIKLLANGDEEQIRHHRSLIENEYYGLKLLSETCDSGECGVVAPVECIQGKLALITKAEEGRRFDKILLNLNPYLCLDRDQRFRVIESAGRWLRRVFDKTKKDRNGADLTQGIFREMESGLERILSWRTRKDWAAWGKSLQQYLRRVSDSVDPSRLNLSWCHGDFTPGNLLVGRNGKVFIFDLTDGGMGLIYDDLAGFWQWLDELGRRRPWYRNEEIEEMKRRLLQNFFQGDIPGDLVGLFVMKRGIGTLCRVIQEKPASTLAKFRRPRREHYWKEKLVEIADVGHGGGRSRGAYG